MSAPFAADEGSVDRFGRSRALHGVRRTAHEPHLVGHHPSCTCRRAAGRVGCRDQVARLIESCGARVARELPCARWSVLVLTVVAGRSSSSRYSAARAAPVSTALRLVAVACGEALEVERAARNGDHITDVPFPGSVPVRVVARAPAVAELEPAAFPARRGLRQGPAAGAPRVLWALFAAPPWPVRRLAAGWSAVPGTAA